MEHIQWNEIKASSAVVGHGAFTHDGDVYIIGGKSQRSSEMEITKLKMERNQSMENRELIFEEEQQYNEDETLSISEELSNFKDESRRWGFAGVYCPPERVYFMHGGFEGGPVNRFTTHSDTRFLLPDDGLSAKILPSTINAPGPRGYHTSVYHPGSRSVYVFGGQRCVDGVYEYFNDLHRLDLGSCTWERVKTSGTPPTPRSQTLGFVWRSDIYFYGGFDGSCVCSFLHKFDVKRGEWTTVETRARKPGDRPDGLAGLTSAASVFFPSKPAGLRIGNKFVLLAEDFLTFKFRVHVLHLKTFRWERLKTPEEKTSEEDFTPDFRFGATLSICDNSLYLIGGRERTADLVSKVVQGENYDNNNGNEDHSILRLNIDRLKCLPWASERLLWLARFKNDQNNCHLAKCPPHIIYHILSYINENTLYVKE